jgi:carbon storage regulator CsrA
MTQANWLVLTRKKGETIVCSVGDTRIVVKLNDIRKSTCSIAIQAQKEVRILRGELEQQAAIGSEKQEALHGG